MKSCPACNRTYADETLTFCLIDGSILSAPYDPHDTQRTTAPQDTDPAPTEALNPAPNPAAHKQSLLQTMRSPEPPPLTSERPQHQAPEKRGNKTGLIVSIAVILGIILAVGVTVSLIWLGKDDAEVDSPDPTGSNTNAVPTGTLAEVPTVMSETSSACGYSLGPEIYHVGDIAGGTFTGLTTLVAGILRIS